MTKLIVGISLVVASVLSATPTSLQQIPKIASGQWHSASCGSIHVSTADAANYISLAADFSKFDPEASLTFCQDGRNACEKNRSKQSAGEKLLVEGKELKGRRLQIGTAQYTLFTVRATKPSPETESCSVTVKVTRQEKITVETVDNADEHMPVLYTVQQIRDILNNSCRDKDGNFLDANGNGTGDTFDTASAHEARTQTVIQNGYYVQVAIPGTAYKCDNFARNACRVLMRNGIDCEIHWYNLARTTHAQIVVTAVEGRKYLEPQLNGDPGYFPSPRSDADVFLKYKVDNENRFTVWDNRAGWTVDTSY